MSRQIGLFSLFLVVALIGPQTTSKVAADDGPPRAINSPLTGKWTYRSWINDPEPVDIEPSDKKCAALTKLLFAEAELIIEDNGTGEMKGKLNIGSSGSLTLFGSVGYGAPFSVRFQGVGKDKGSPSEGWVYDYVGWLVPSWPNGVDQKPAIVGSVIRTVPHSNGKATAGKVASFVAVRKD
jgi:hypothetical protein